MQDEWRLTAVSELLERGALFIGDGYRAKNAEFGLTGLPFARVGNIDADGEIDLRKADLFPERDRHKVGNKISQPGDIAFTSKGTVGRFVFVKEGMRRFVYSPQISFWRVLDRTEIEPRFLIYWMRGKEFGEQVHGLKGQTDMADYVSLNDQRQMMITLPPLPIQRRIAEILGRLDDKIEVNRRINRTLERMAQALYKHWFVDFGPFQDREFVESEVGLAPRGWEVVTVGDVCQVVNGATPSTKVAEYWDGGDICWATPTDMTALTAPVIFDTAKKITRLGLENCSATLLPVGSVLVTSRATIGISAINYVPMATNQGFKSLICRPRATNHFMLLTMKNRVDEMIGRANGTTFLEINSTSFKGLELVLPSQEVMMAFDRQVKPYFDQIYANQQENVSLARTRDYLLPRLLAGE